MILGPGGSQAGLSFRGDESCDFGPGRNFGLKRQPPDGIRESNCWELVVVLAGVHLCNAVMHLLG